LDSITEKIQKVKAGGALVRMAGKYFWPAFYQARAEAGKKEWPERGISWREFRILCAILSVKKNRSDFSFIGWETIQHRACGFTSKKAYKDAEVIPDHLAPPLTRKHNQGPLVIDWRTSDSSPDSSSRHQKRGGLTAYSVRHSREELGDVVCQFSNFRNRAKIKQNRADDAAKCLQLLERAKSGPSQGQG
jgi:hypothetical protein